MKAFHLLQHIFKNTGISIGTRFKRIKINFTFNLTLSLTAYFYNF